MLKRLFSFEANPVLLYELRQMVRSRFVIVLMSVYLAALVLLTAGSLPEEGGIFDWINTTFPGMFWMIGSGQRSTLLAISIFLLYYFFTTLILVLLGSARTASERIAENPMFYTTMPPRRIVWGKMLFGLLFGLFFLSLTLPFLSVAYLLRGLDIRVVFAGAVTHFSMVQIQYFVSVTCFSGATTKWRAILYAVPFFFIQLITTLYSLMVLPSASLSVLNMGGSREFWGLLAGGTVLTATILFVLFLLALVRFAPETSNRMLPMRVGMTSLAVTTMLLCGVCKYCEFSSSLSPILSGINSFVTMLGYFCWYMLPFLFLICICERDRLSLRIRRTVPRSLVGRVLAFPFYTGAAGALIWCLLITVGILLFGVVLGNGFYGSPESRFVARYSAFSGVLLLWDYCALILLLYNLVFHRWISREWNWVPLFALLGFFLVMGLATFLVWITLSIDLPFFERFSLWGLLPYPCWLDDYWQLKTQLTWALILAFALLALNGPWVVRRFREFRRPEEPPKKAEDENGAEISSLEAVLS